MKIEKDLAESYLSQLTSFAKKYDFKDLELFINQTFDEDFWESVLFVEQNFQNFLKHHKKHNGIDLNNLKDDDM